MLIAAVACVAVACDRAETDEALVTEFTHTGCSRDTKASDVDEAGESLLILRYTSAGLEVTRTNAMLNCSIRNDGIACEAQLVGSDIYYRTYELGDQPLKCLCNVERMSSVVTGLKPGRTYTLHYTCRDSYAPIEIDFRKGLDLVLDIDLYKLPTP